MQVHLPILLGMLVLRPSRLSSKNNSCVPKAYFPDDNSQYLKCFAQQDWWQNFLHPSLDELEQKSSRTRNSALHELRLTALVHEHSRLNLRLVVNQTRTTWRISISSFVSRDTTTLEVHTWSLGENVFLGPHTESQASTSLPIGMLRLPSLMISEIENLVGTAVARVARVAKGINILSFILVVAAIRTVVWNIQYWAKMWIVDPTDFVIDGTSLQIIGRGP